MKKILLTTAMMLSVCNANAYVDSGCINIETLEHQGPDPLSMIQKCESAWKWYGSSRQEQHCATYDIYNSMFIERADGSCYVLEACATCESGYDFDPTAEPAQIQYTDMCWYSGDNPGLKDLINVVNANSWAYIDVCKKITRTPCPAGYYDEAREGDLESACTACPVWDAAYTTSALTQKVRATSQSGSTSITDCYIPSGTYYYDATGKFKLNSRCSY